MNRISKLIDNMQPDELWYVVKTLGTLENLRVIDMVVWNTKECKEFLFDRLTDYEQNVRPKPDYYGKRAPQEHAIPQQNDLPQCHSEDYTNQLMPEMEDI